MCPYARFQSAMFDQDTLVISYDSKRGEPRGGRRRNADPGELGLGACINCTLCVQVCPTGIDIRDGLQIECIACAACVDVCDQVMDKMDYPRGLVRYTTEHGVAGEKTRVMRPRVLIYAALLLAVTTILTVSIAGRTPLRMEVIRDRNALYRVIDPGMIENVYTLRLINMETEDRRYLIEVAGLDGLSMASDPEVTIAAGESATIPLRLRAATDMGHGGKSIRFQVTSRADKTVMVSRDSKFFLPIK
jgi:cytochrome c oxidase accessory protein FixG